MPGHDVPHVGMRRRGTNIWWHRGTPERANYGPIEPLGWFDESN